MAATDTLLSVPARGSLEHAVAVQAGVRVGWCVAVGGDLDVTLSCNFEPAGATGAAAAAVPVINPGRCTGDMGSFKPPAAGRLVFAFDNSFSMLRSKAVTLSVATGDDNSHVLSWDPILANEHVMRGIEMFFTNRFDEAEEFFAVHKDRVLVHNLSWATLRFFRALMTWEPEEIALAQARVKATQAMAEGQMPREGVLSSLRGMVSLGGGKAAAPPEGPPSPMSSGGLASPNSSSGAAPTTPTSSAGGAGGGGAGGMTPNQLEATLVYAEATMLTALLSLMEESIMALVRTGLSIRSGWKVYTSADRALGGGGGSGGVIMRAVCRESPQMQVLLGDLPRAGGIFPRAGGASAYGALVPPGVPPGASPAASPLIPGVHGHVLGGLEFGLGAFNCLASILPPIVLRVIAVLGFPSDRAAGLSQLRASLLAGGISAPLAALFLLTMRVLLPSFHSGDVSEHLPEAEAILELMLARYTDSALFLWLAGRMARMQGDVGKSTALLQRCQTIRAWPQLTHLCEYELGWCAAFSHDWAGVLPRFGTLAAENAWSKVFYNFMSAQALLQLGRVGEARAAFVKVLRLWAGEASRKLGNKVISADQYALRRAAEFVAFTTIEGPPGEGGADGGDDSEAVVAAVLAASGGGAAASGGPKLRLPWRVPRGSAAHAAVLAAPLTLPGLECIYFFNGASQMDDVALGSAVAQCDAVLGAIAGGCVFDGSLPHWKGQTPAAGDAGAKTAWTDAAASGDAQQASAAAAASATAPPVPAADVTALLNKAVAVPTRHWDASSLPPDDGPASPAAPADGANSDGGARKRGGGGGGGFGFGSLMSSVTSGIRTTVSSAAAVANAATGGAIPAAFSLVGGGGSPAAAPALPAYARPTPLTPFHAVTVAALVRGALCASLGRVDEAAACFTWLIDNAAGHGTAKRELQALGYAHYELGVLYVDAAKAMQQQGGGGGAAAHAAPAPAAASTGPTRHGHGSGHGSAAGTSAAAVHSRKVAGLLSSQLVAGLSLRECVARARQHLKAARDVRDDFNWRVRLHLRVHLSMDDLRRRGGTGGGGKGAAGGGGTGGWGTTDWGSAAEDATACATADDEEDDEEEDDGGGDTGLTPEDEAVARELEAADGPAGAGGR